MPSSKYCLVCGFSKDEVEKMHRFPVNEAKSKVWQENMGIKHVPGIKLSNHDPIQERVIEMDVLSSTNTGELEQRTLATATFVKQVDELFDSFNGTHHEYWRKAFNIIRQWHFQRYTTTQSSVPTKPPSQTGWLTTINAIQGIWAYLHSRGVKSLRPRSLNQDPLENLFGGIRGGCGSGDNPTAAQFSGSLKTQILNGLTHQKIIGSNCEEDEHQLLSNLTEFLVISDQAEEVVIPTMTHLEQRQILNDNVADEIAKAVAVGATATLSVAYVSGFVAKKFFENLDCVACRSQMLSSSKDPHNLFISFKEWAEEEHLQYPSEALVVAIGHAVTVLERTLEDHCTKPSISVVVSEAISENVNFSALSCNEHENTVTKNIIRAVWKIGLPWWCKRKNQLNLQTRKDTRSKKRKVKKFQHV
ncbi:hypothetical protein NQ317_000971 [Molorchus minor]|uniref:Transposable element P transposase-like RNase H C-terminal domain-containing protein n=1 Tax=Molorchus minor TaxID=1323400 RepID=A0ABQ9IQ55_9CUCU|nr:hypothetical protein NQ317_000971 [Molorchus minor]